MTTSFCPSVPAVCLNLDHRAGERDRIRAEFAPYGIQPTFFGCGEGKLFPFIWYDRVDKAPPPGREGYSAWVNRPNSWNAFQCFRTIIEKAKRDKLEKLLLLEDDVALEPHFGETFEKALRDVQNNDPWWQLLYLSANHTYRATVEVTPNLLRLAGSGGFHCVLLHRRSYQHILDLPLDAPIDEMVGQWIHPYGHSYGAWPNAAFQQAGYSFCEGGTYDYRASYVSKGINHKNE